jgi:hypothetical protein
METEDMNRRGNAFPAPGKNAPAAGRLSAARRSQRKKAIAREFEMKRRELGLDSGPVMKKGMTGAPCFAAKRNGYPPPD